MFDTGQTPDKPRPLLKVVRCTLTIQADIAEAATGSSRPDTSPSGVSILGRSRRDRRGVRGQEGCSHDPDDDAIRWCRHLWGRGLAKRASAVYQGRVIFS